MKSHCWCHHSSSGFDSPCQHYCLSLVNGRLRVRWEVEQSHSMDLELVGIILGPFSAAKRLAFPVASFQKDRSLCQKTVAALAWRAEAGWSPGSCPLSAFCCPCSELPPLFPYRCKQNQDMLTFYAVVIGLNNAPVSRLRLTWEVWWILDLPGMWWRLCLYIQYEDAPLCNSFLPLSDSSTK